jgi:hypothetical protein
VRDRPEMSWLLARNWPQPPLKMIFIRPASRPTRLRQPVPESAGHGERCSAARRRDGRPHGLPAGGETAAPRPPTLGGHMGGPHRLRRALVSGLIEVDSDARCIETQVAATGMWRPCTARLGPQGALSAHPLGKRGRPGWPLRRTVHKAALARRSCTESRRTRVHLAPDTVADRDDRCGRRSRISPRTWVHFSSSLTAVQVRTGRQHVVPLLNDRLRRCRT